MILHYLIYLEVVRKKERKEHEKENVLDVLRKKDVEKVETKQKKEEKEQEEEKRKLKKRNAQEEKNNFIINNIDINIITQTPKISKYKNKIIKSVSNICEINENQINVKGKTTEKLGVIGKEKAIACEVIASIAKHD